MIDVAVFGDREPGASPDGKLLALEKRRIDDLLELDPLAGEPSTAASDAVIADRDDRL